MAKQPKGRAKEKKRIAPDTQRLWEVRNFPAGAYKDHPRGTK